MKTNILVLSAGRRVELVQAFQYELKEVFSSALVFCTDMYPELSAACQVADGIFQVPRVTNPDYLDKILELCSQNNISLIIPTIDTELLLLAENRKRFSDVGIDVIISDLSLVEHCRDKRKTAALFEVLNIDQPAIFDRENLSFPLFCKPYDGSCSVGAVAINSSHEMTKGLLENPKNMFMELVPKSFSEYTVDAYYTKSGNLISLIPRKRLEVRGGEVSKGVTRKNFVYKYLLERVLFLEGARGCITFQFFVDEVNESIKGLEINPRFGGGYPLSYEAGANFPRYLISEYMLNEKIKFSDSWEADLTMLRYDAKVLVRG